jgi:hypothetical protein
MIVALAVAGVAVSVFVGMFNACLNVSRSQRNRTIAMELAEEQLAAITRNPEKFIWHSQNSSGKFPVTLHELPPVGNYPCTPPEVKMFSNGEQIRLEQRYSQFHWYAFGQVPEKDSRAYEVTAVIYWLEAGRPQTLTLTSAVARAFVDNAQSPPKERGRT